MEKYQVRPLKIVRPDQAGLDLKEYQQSIMVWLLLLEAIPLIAWQLFANHALLLLLIVVVHGLGFWLVFKNVYLTGLVWAVGLAMLITAVVVVYGAFPAIFLLGLIPLVIALVYGLIPGLFSEILLVFFVLNLPRIFPQMQGLQPFVALATAGSFAAAVVSSVCRYWMLDILQNYYENYLQATEGIEKARQQRLELKQIQEDMIHANRELARLTQQLKIANQTAEEARQAKETFVATVSHELRTPLNMIIGFSEVIAQSPQIYGMRLPPSLLADIASIQRNSQHLLELVNDVLDLSQVDMGNLSISCRWCSLRQVVQESIEVIRPLFVSKRLYLTPELPEEDVLIYCDQTRIREVIINLLSNAGRFTETGGVILRVAPGEQELVISVEDTGPGISPENQKKLFEPFQQIDSSIRRQHGGSGLGLTISKRFVEMHGGKMWLESMVGAGTTFFFSLPMPVSETDSQGRVSRWINEYSVVDVRPRPFKAPLVSPLPRFVVYEEGDTVQRMIERYLGDVEVAVVQAPEQIVDEVSQSSAQLLIINHPEAEKVLRAVHESSTLPAGLPILAFWLPGKADAAVSMGIQKYLIKPVNKDILLKALECIPEPVKNILLVDDNPEVLQLFGRILASADRGYKVLRASDGHQALEMLRKRKPDVMIMDLVMADLSGWDVLEEKARDSKIANIPVIVVSAQDPSGTLQVNGPVLLRRAGGFSPKDLLELVRSVGKVQEPEKRS